MRYYFWIHINASVSLSHSNTVTHKQSHELLFELLGGALVGEHGGDGFKDLVGGKLLGAIAAGSAWRRHMHTFIRAQNSLFPKPPTDVSYSYLYVFTLE